MHLVSLYEVFDFYAVTHCDVFPSIKLFFLDTAELLDSRYVSALKFISNPFEFEILE